MPKPLKTLEPWRGVDHWVGAELRHCRTAAELDQPELAARSNVSTSLISKLELGQRSLQVDIAKKLDEALRTDGFFVRAMPLVESQRDKVAFELDNPLNAGLLLGKHAGPRGMLGQADQSLTEEPEVNRREFLASTGAWAALLATGTARMPGMADLIAVVLDTAPTYSGDLATLDELEGGFAIAKREYQACKYREVLERLPGLVQQLHLAEGETSDADRLAALRANAYQVVAGVMLKHSEQTLATLAADRSMTSANLLGDPIAVASSARAVTHVLLRTGYADVAADFAAKQALLLDSEPRTPVNLSVQGALLLRGAVAAADAGRRAKSSELLDAADTASAQLENSDNLRGTGFNRVNVSLHRVNIAIALGDAGRAIEIARDIDMTSISLVERHVSLAIDVARAFALWGRYERAMDTLYYAEATAPQEVRVRKGVSELLTTIEGAAPPSVRPHAREFAKKLATV
ncbi:helix-turn-helix domain-containing protein [Glycomyces harbinensis]|uniref:Helix-turn-helix domain-containing protein n=1 Tax=Glycomyces harbinensis TaxID=58114 RepID=A0A1G7BJT5_9ACTN|nr:helix-turn-helix transcriptional regulator [Glycomyces harbinensis]SDE27381.1 Helix-turn-helix domain-containing protein [Glycomyces harbinensis]